MRPIVGVNAVVVHLEETSFFFVVVCVCVCVCTWVQAGLSILCVYCVLVHLREITSNTLTLFVVYD